MTDRQARLDDPLYGTRFAWAGPSVDVCADAEPRKDEAMTMAPPASQYCRDRLEARVKLLADEAMRLHRQADALDQEVLVIRDLCRWLNKEFFTADPAAAFRLADYFEKHEG